MSRLPTIPSCESVHHLLAVEKNQKGFLTPVGTDDEEEDGETEPGAHPWRAGSGSWHRQLSPCSVLSAASSSRLFAEPAQTLIFLDWDDTIFPCTEIFHKRGYSRKTREWREPLPEAFACELAEWRQAAQDFLKAACGISDRCVIVTNSKPPWVNACVEHFAPNLKQILEDRPHNLSIVYASEFMKPPKSASDKCSEKAEEMFIKVLQSCFSGCFQDFTTKVVESMHAMRRNAPRPKFDLTEAKLKAMTAEAQSFYSQYQNQTWKNIISLGDMAYEYDAVKTLSATRGACALPREKLRTKSMVLLPSPSLHGLTLQLRIWSQVLPACARFDGDIDIDVSSNFAPFQELARALQLPTLAKLQVPQVYLQPISQPFDDDFMNGEELGGGPAAANELLDQLPILLHDAFFCPPKEAFHYVS